MTIAPKAAAVLAVIAGLAVGAGFQAAAAGKGTLHKPESSTSRTVNFADLDLSDPADAAELHQRITRAARIACRHQNEVRSVLAYLLYKKCIALAVEDAVAKVNDANLSNVHRAETQSVARK